MTSRVSTRMSRSAVSPTSGAAARRRRWRGAVAPRSTSRRSPAADAAAGAQPRRWRAVPGRLSWLRLRLDDQRLIAVQHDERQENCDENAAFHYYPMRDRIVAGGAERVARASRRAASQPPRRRPWRSNRLGRVVGARRAETGRTPRNTAREQLIAREQRERRARLATAARAGVRDGVRYSASRAVRLASSSSRLARRRRRSPARSCYDGKPLESIV